MAENVQPGRLATRYVFGVAVLIGLPCAVTAQFTPNTRPVTILGSFDLNLDGAQDSTFVRLADGTFSLGSIQAADSDADGLPDTWELGGLDGQNTSVPFPAPQAIVPGTPSVSLFSRLPVFTNASSADTDGDGLTDFIEVFGLKFIDDDRNGVLDADEWNDINGDGMPSIGEFPLVNVICAACPNQFDFDGFVFTNPALGDTDGDGVGDSVDPDPLVNPLAFGATPDVSINGIAVGFGSPGLRSDLDKDDDGLGNGMDLGDDDLGVLDNPSDLRLVLEQFRRDVLDADNSSNRVPEALLDDLLGADWNGDGVFRLTDVADPHFGIVNADQTTASAAGVPLFFVNIRFGPAVAEVVSMQLFAATPFPANFDSNVYYSADERDNVQAPLPFQELLQPISLRDNAFLPDPRIWTVLYAWRMPGFDVDGNGFIGYDNESFRGIVDLNGAPLPSPPVPNPTSTIRITSVVSSGASGLDGVIDASFGNCGGLLGLSSGFALTIIGLSASRVRRP